VYSAHIMLNYVIRFNLWPKGQAGVANWMWQIMAACSCNTSVQQAEYIATARVYISVLEL